MLACARRTRCGVPSGVCSIAMRSFMPEVRSFPRGGLVYSIETAFAAMLVLTASCTPNSATRDDPRLARLLEDRQAIWQAWFTNDRSRLELLLPNSVIAITNGDTTWQDRSAVLAAAAAFARSGGKLVSLNF